MGNTTYGYVRVSSKDQNEARQMIAMREFGIDDKNIIIEKQSGKDFNRPQYKSILGRIKAGDIQAKGDRAFGIVRSIPLENYVISPPSLRQTRKRPPLGTFIRSLRYAIRSILP